MVGDRGGEGEGSFTASGNVIIMSVKVEEVFGDVGAGWSGVGEELGMLSVANLCLRAIF